MKSEEIKKRIMFQVDKDACFLTYNILIILDFLKCYSSDTAFNDFKKISYIISFISSNTLTNLLTKDSLTSKEKSTINASYLNSLERQNKVFLVLQYLKKNNFIEVVFDKEKPQENQLYILDKSKIKNILLKDVFKYEYKNLETINNLKAINGLRRLKLSTLLEKIYKDREIKIWDI